jgi:hypothetical protein
MQVVAVVIAEVDKGHVAVFHARMVLVMEQAIVGQKSSRRSVAIEASRH